MRLSIADLTRSDSFFDTLASKDATLESLQIDDEQMTVIGLMSQSLMFRLRED